MKNPLVLAQQIYDELDGVEYGTWSEKLHKALDEDAIGSDEFNNCRVYFDSESLQVGYGCCWDQALYSYWRFKQEGLEKFCIPLARVLWTEEHSCKTHTTLLIKDQRSIYWLEHAFRRQAGLHGPYKNINDFKKEIIHIYTYHGRYTKDQLEFNFKPDFDKCISEGKNLTCGRFFEIIFKHA